MRIAEHSIRVARRSIARRRAWLAKNRRSRRWSFLLGAALAAFMVWLGWYGVRHLNPPGVQPGPWWNNIEYLGAVVVLILSWFTRLKFWWVIAVSAFIFFITPLLL